MSKDNETFKKIADIMNTMRETVEQVIWETMKEVSTVLGIPLINPDSRAIFSLVTDKDSAEAYAESGDPRGVTGLRQYLAEEEPQEPEPVPIDLKHLPTGLLKYRTEKGWYVRANIEEGDRDLDSDEEYQRQRTKQQNDINAWLCSMRTTEQANAGESFGLLMWIQALPKSISKRTNDQRDRSYPSRQKTGIYVNASEMEYIEQLAKAQEVTIREKEFERQ